MKYHDFLGDLWRVIAKYYQRVSVTERDRQECHQEFCALAEKYGAPKDRYIAQVTGETYEEICRIWKERTNETKL